MPAIVRPEELAKLIHDIDNTESGSFCTIKILKLLPRLFLRLNELRCLKWEYVDFNDRIIRIPAEEMKRSREHLVSLADQVVEHLKQTRDVIGYSEFVFPNAPDASKPISKNVITNRLRDLGYPADVV